MTFIDRYAVLGNPVQHSQSPFIHASFAEATGQAVDYTRVLCPLDAFESTVRAFADCGARGCNITVPFKFEALPLATRTSDRARLAQAANLLRFDAGGWFADNTDGCGLVRDIEANAGVPIEGQRVLLIGAGGAAAGVLGPMIEAGAAEVVVANRTPENAERLVERHVLIASAREANLLACSTLQGDRREAHHREHREEENPEEVRKATGRADSERQSGEGTESGHPLTRGFDIVINASASSLAGHPVPVPASVLKPGALAIDLMYGAAARPFIAWAEAHGALGRDGLGMLVEQAAEAFFVWRGVRPETTAVLAALRARLKAAT